MCVTLSRVSVCVTDIEMMKVSGLSRSFPDYHYHLAMLMLIVDVDRAQQK